MGYVLFGDDWVNAYKESLGRSAEYRKAAAKWEWPLVLKVQKDPSLGLPDDLAVYLDLWHGECRGARVATAADLESAPYIVSADAFTWKQVLEKKMEPIGGIVRGKLKLARGSIITLAGYVQAAKYLVEAATEVATDFPGGL
ncbi:MAG TPA: SCP2 sterol-binding domain-containing protein [Symbiobacteriaceae bacterium]